MNIEQIKIKGCGQALGMRKGEVVNIDLVLGSMLIGRWYWELKQISKDSYSYMTSDIVESSVGLWGLLLGLKKNLSNI